MDPDRERMINGRSKKKKSKPSHSAPAKSGSTSVNALKSNIRSVGRVLEHAQDMPLDVRIEKERALAGYKQDLEKAQYDRERQRMITKYHMVRFFERQKATRNLKKLRTRLSSSKSGSSEHEALKSAIHNAEVDLNYTLYHPLMEKYVGIFPRKATQGASDGSDAPEIKTVLARKVKPAMWAVVETCMESGTLQALRDGNLQIGTVQQKTPRSTSADTRHHHVSEKQQKARQSKTDATPLVNEQGDESDGAFFE